MRRRDFMRRTLAGMALPVLPVTRALALQGPEADGRLIVLFLRGGLDGLFAFSPVADPALAEVRPQLSQTVLREGIALAGTGFAAHPSCRALADLYAAGELAFAPCAGTTDTSRSHFQAQDLFELGSGASHGSSGFMARAAEVLGARHGAISFTRDVPLAFRGGARMPEVAPLSGSGLRLPEGRVLDAIRAAHRGLPSGDALERAIATEAEIESSMGMEPQAGRGAPGARAFQGMAANMGRLLRGNPRLTLVFADLGGMDTHANQEAGLARTLEGLGQGIAALRDALGAPEWRRTRIAVMSEFGRTVRENGTRGTDHGHGGLLLLAGGAIHGGRMLGDFKGLSDGALHEGRDLPVLLDWRAVLAACMRASYGVDDDGLARIFPGRPGGRVGV